MIQLVRASFPPAENLDQATERRPTRTDPSGLGVHLGDVEIHRATTTIRRGRYADGFEVGIVTLDSGVSTNERWRFEHGLEVMLAHSWDPGIIPIRDVSAARNAYAVVCTSGPLASLPVLDIPLEHRLRIVRQVGLTLNTLHASGHVHGCLSPHNIIIAHELDPVLDEVAMVNLQETIKGDADNTLGYRAYAAPETSHLSEPTVASDVYSLGRLMEQLLLGELPEPGTSTGLVARKLAGRVSQDLIDVVRRCLAHCPAHRYPTVGAVLEEASLATGRP